MEELNLRVGYKFSPTESELLLHYLLNKILGRNLPADIIPTFDCFSCCPDRLPFELFRYGKQDEWYFFSSGSEGKIVLSTQDGGYYQLSQQKQKNEGDQVIGSVRTFDYYSGIFPCGIKSQWFVQEFKLHPLFLHTYLQEGDTLATDSNIVACKVVRNDEADDQRQFF